MKWRTVFVSLPGCLFACEVKFCFFVCLFVCEVKFVFVCLFLRFVLFTVLLLFRLFVYELV